MTQYSIYGKNRKNLENAVRNREEFKTSGSLQGFVTPIRPYFNLDRLNSDTRKSYEWDREHDNIAYVVLSYVTPIAWFTREGVWKVTRQTFSATTSRHQSAVRAGIGYATDYMPV